MASRAKWTTSRPTIAPGGRRPSRPARRPGTRARPASQPATGWHATDARSRGRTAKTPSRQDRGGTRRYVGLGGLHGQQDDDHGQHPATLRHSLATARKASGMASQSFKLACCWQRGQRGGLVFRVARRHDLNARRRPPAGRHGRRPRRRPERRGATRRPARRRPPWDPPWLPGTVSSPPASNAEAGYVYLTPKNSVFLESYP